MANNNTDLHWLNEVTFNADGLIPVVSQDHHSGRILMMAWMNAESLSLTVTNKVATYYSRSRQQLWRKGETSGHTQQVHNIRLDCDSDVIIISITQIGGIACHTGRESCFYKELTLENSEYIWKEQDPVLKNPDDIYNNSASGLKKSEKPTNEPLDTVKDKNTILSQLDKTLQERKQTDADSSYVASLYAKGLNKILEKVGEESVETVIAAKDYQYHIETGKTQSTTKFNNSSLQDTTDNQGAYLKNDLIYEVADVWFHTLITLAWFDISSEAVLTELARRFGLSGIEEKNSRT